MTDLVLRFPGASVRSHVRLERGGLARLGAFTKRTTAARHVVLVTDPRVARFHGESALASLRRAGLAVDTVMVPAGEGAKRATVLARLWDAFGAAGLARDGAVVALGGGSAMDVGKTIAGIACGSAPAQHYGLCANPFPASRLYSVCVPTTSGTGSEATRTAVLADANHALRPLGRVVARGRGEPVAIWEVLDAESESVRRVLQHGPGGNQMGVRRYGEGAARP